MNVEQPKEEEKEKQKEEEQKKEQAAGGESSALQQAERAKAALIEGKTRIYPKGVMDPIV